MRTLLCQALLFDLDGTLIDSHPAVDRCWRKFCDRHGLAWEEIQQRIYGRRSIDSIRLLLPNVDAEAENMVLRNMEANDTEGVVPILGAADFLRKLPRDRWAVVTSGTSDVGGARFHSVDFPEPGAFVFGEDVSEGKPHPAPYLLGAKRLGFLPSDCVGFEDTVAGATSIQTAGMTPIGIALETEEFWIPDYTKIDVEITEGGALRLMLP